MLAVISNSLPANSGRKIKGTFYIIVGCSVVYLLGRGFIEVFGEGYTKRVQRGTSLVGASPSRHAIPILTSKLHSNRSSLTGSVRRKRFPDVVIVGAKKCGTTALVAMLTSAHSNVKKVFGKEPHFYDRNFDLGLQWYLEQMPIIDDDDILLEKTPSYLITPIAAEEIMKVGSSVILMLCNPMTRVLSDYGHNKRKIKEPPYPKIEDMVLDDQGNINATADIIIPSLYSDHLPRYLAHFPLGKNLHIVDGDKFATRPWEEVGLAEKFLSLPPKLSEPSMFHHNNKESKSKLYCWDTENKNTAKEHCLEAARGIEHVTLSKDMEKKLVEFFQPYNDKLFEMLGRTFDWSDYH